MPNQRGIHIYSRKSVGYQRWVETWDDDYRWSVLYWSSAGTVMLECQTKIRREWCRWLEGPRGIWQMDEFRRNEWDKQIVEMIQRQMISRKVVRRSRGGRSTFESPGQRSYPTHLKYFSELLALYPTTLSRTTLRQSKTDYILEE